MSDNGRAVDLAVEDFDDVEAHGMREVMAGLGAVAVIAGGAAAMTDQLSSDVGGGSRGIHAANAIGAKALGADAVDRLAVTDSLDGPVSFRSLRVEAAVAQDVLRHAGGAVQDADVDDVSSPNRVGLLQRTDDRVDSAVDHARELRDAAVSDVGDITEAAGRTATETVREAAATVREAPGTAREAVDDVRQGTVTTPDVRETVRSADRTVDATLVLAGDTIRSVSGTAMTTIARVQPQVGSDVDVKDASGWVTVTVGGEQVARAEVKDGQASLSWQAPDADAPVVFSYSGSDVLSPASVTL